MRHLLILTALAAVLLPVWASNPGEPLDCDDWVFLEPGFSCTELVPLDIDPSPLFRQSGSLAEADNEGRVVGLWRQRSEVCGSRFLFRYNLIALEANGGESILGYLEERCVDSSEARADELDTHEDANTPLGNDELLSYLTFDSTAGEIKIPLFSFCRQARPTPPFDPIGCLQPYSYDATWLSVIGGFAPMFEILQTYAPSTNDLSFRVPSAPEGFAVADRFDTYYGDLATVGDWSQAQSLQCSFPAAIPEAGDYLTVTDSLPDPAPGAGRYYVTAVHHMGQTRYGRKNIGGVLSGRDPSVLPPCVR